MTPVMYKVVKDYHVGEDTAEVLKQGTELIVDQFGRILVNGGLPWPSTVPILEKLIRSEMEHKNYLREIPIRTNKI